MTLKKRIYSYAGHLKKDPSYWINPITYDRMEAMLLDLNNCLRVAMRDKEFEMLLPDFTADDCLIFLYWPKETYNSCVAIKMYFERITACVGDNECVVFSPNDFSVELFDMIYDYHVNMKYLLCEGEYEVV